MKLKRWKNHDGGEGKKSLLMSVDGGKKTEVKYEIELISRQCTKEEFFRRIKSDERFLGTTNKVRKHPKDALDYNRN